MADNDPIRAAQARAIMERFEREDIYRVFGPSDTVVARGTPAHLFDPSYSDTGCCVVCSQPASHPIHIKKETP